ncbi:MAG: hypothetical protein RRA15_09235 [bacterium]|nr:hypothetical protein [bacterium]MDT8366664.1 hypothetical protein [bacterium]
MKKMALLAVAFLVLLPGLVKADEFSLYGVKMGMARAEVETHWQKLDEDKYHIEDSILMNVMPEFDHMDRLYQLSFSIPIPLLDQHPGPYVTTTFQDLIQERWASDDQIVSLRTGRGNAGIMITSKHLQVEYTGHIRTQMELQLGILLKP